MLNSTYPGTVSSIRPLDIAGIRWLIERLKALDERDTGRRIVEFMLYTGAHPSVLGDPKRYNLGLGSDGLLTWHRPKTRDLVIVPIPPGPRLWIPDLIRHLSHERYHPVTVNRFVHETGALCGMPDLTPRCLRHTFGYIVWLETHDVNRVMSVLSCSAKVALNYIKLDPSGWHNILTTGWTNA